MTSDRRRLMMASFAARGGHSGEKYIRATDRAYIDTGVSQLTVGRLEVKFCPSNVRYGNDANAQWHKICGGRTAHNTSNALSVYFNTDTYRVGAAIGGTFVDGLFSNIQPGTWHTVVWDFSTARVSLDGVTAPNNFPAPTGSSCNFYLFATGGQSGQESPGSIAYCTLWDKSGNLIWNGKPHKSGWQVGMYDTVSGNVFNAPTGTLLRGEVPPASGLHYFTYLQGDGAAYIDSLLDVSGQAFDISGKFIRLRDTVTEDSIISNFQTGYSYWSVFTSIHYNQRICLYTAAINVLYDAIPAIGQEVSLGLSWAGGSYTMTALGGTLTAAQGNANPLTVRLLARGQITSQYPPSVMALKDEWTMVVGGVTQRKLRPCSYNGQAGMYDSENEVFYPNANTTGFFVLDKEV